MRKIPYFDKSVNDKPDLALKELQLKSKDTTPAMATKKPFNALVEGLKITESGKEGTLVELFVQFAAAMSSGTGDQ